MTSTYRYCELQLALYFSREVEHFFQRNQKHLSTGSIQIKLGRKVFMVGEITQLSQNSFCVKFPVLPKLEEKDLEVAHDSSGLITELHKMLSSINITHSFTCSEGIECPRKLHAPLMDAFKNLDLKKD